MPPMPAPEDEVPEEMAVALTVVASAALRCGERMLGESAGIFLDLWMLPGDGERGFAVVERPESRTVALHFVYRLGAA